MAEIQNQKNRKLVALLSTGLDSPVACYLMMKQGFDIISLSFLNGGEKAEINKKKILTIGKKLVELTHRSIHMHFVNYDSYLDEFILNCERKVTCILCKRTMLYTATALAKKYKAEGIINGDILGEQASQTLDNLFVVHQINLEVPVLRPLIGFDKLDVIRISRATGLYDLSLLEGIGCTRNPKYPETHARLEMIEECEKNIDRPTMLKAMLAKIEQIDLIA
jgi:thiamine biosynthesis protein ThiI